MPPDNSSNGLDPVAPLAGEAPTVAIYRDTLLEYSEPWIVRQAAAFSRYRPRFVGTLRKPNLLLDRIPDEHVAVLADLAPAWASAPLRVAYKVSGLAWPPWTHRVRAWRPHLVHAHFGPDGVWARWMARRFGIPLVVTFHGYDITVPRESIGRRGLTTPLYYRRRPALFAEASKVIAVSGFIRDRLIEAGCPSEKIVVHYIGVDTHAFRPGPASSRDRQVVFVGRLVHKKGVRDLLAAMAQVLEAMPDASLKVIGDGPLRADLEAFARGLGGQVSFLGRVAHEDVVRHLAQARVFCVPSVVAQDGDTEGFGIVFAEAQAMGVPVVSYATGGIPEAVDAGRSGFLAEPGDVRGLATALARILGEEPASWNERSRRARSFVTERFDVRNQSRKLEAIYDTVRAEASGG